MTFSDKKVRVGVVGVGYFGRYHALKLAAHPRAWLVGLADHHPEQLVNVAAECSAQAYTSHEALLGEVDAVSIATPAFTHAELVGAFLESGAHVLVEKPLATTVAEVDPLVGLAGRKGLVLQVGHQERAVLAALGLLALDERPIGIECVRKGPFTGRNLDVSVALDLLTHDLDMVFALNGSDIAAVTARGAPVRSAMADWVDADMTLTDGCRVRLIASRVHDRVERTMRLTYPSGVIAVDFLSRRVVNHSRHHLPEINAAQGGDTVMLDDPLGYAVDRFLKAIQGETDPLVSGADAKFAIAAAGRIDDVLLAADVPKAEAIPVT